MDKQLLISIILNFIIIAFVVFSVIAMFLNFNFMKIKDENCLAAIGVEAFKYFTIDSNVLMGLCSILYVIYAFLFNAGVITVIPKFVYVIQLVGTASVSLTMIITVCFLAPFAKTGYFSLFYNNNLFFHLIIPLFAIVTFGLFEKSNTLTWIDSLYGLIPMVLYGIAYSINCLTRIENGQVDRKYDWYGFLAFGLKTLPIVLIVMVLLTFGISIGLFAINM